ncbi:MAG: hypothetical protein WD355_10655 [Balneolaceae bacterium]
MKTFKYMISISVLILTGCLFDNSDDPTSLDEPPTIIGEVTALNYNENGEIFEILIEENPEVVEPSEPGGVKIWFSLPDATEILKRNESGTLAQYGPEHLEEALLVEGWAKSILVDTHPQRGPAKRIVVIE